MSAAESFDRSTNRALDDLFLSNWSLLRDFAQAILGCPDDAADVVQALYISLRSRGGLPTGVNVWYLVQAIRNSARTLLRRRALRQRALDRWWLEFEPPRAPCPERARRQNRARELLAQAMDALPEGQRRVLTKTLDAGLTPAEVAEDLGIGVRTVIQQNFRARRRVEAWLRSRGVKGVGDL